MTRIPRPRQGRARAGLAVKLKVRLPRATAGYRAQAAQDDAKPWQAMASHTRPPTEAVRPDGVRKSRRVPTARAYLRWPRQQRRVSSAFTWEIRHF